MWFLANTAVRALGVVLIGLGVVGLFLPILQGVLFLVLGVYVYSFASPRMRRWIDSKLVNYPRMAAVCARVDARIHKIFRLPTPHEPSS